MRQSVLLFARYLLSASNFGCRDPALRSCLDSLQILNPLEAVTTRLEGLVADFAKRVHFMTRPPSGVCHAMLPRCSQGCCYLRGCHVCRLMQERGSLGRSSRGPSAAAGQSAPLPTLLRMERTQASRAFADAQPTPCLLPLLPA